MLEKLLRKLLTAAANDIKKNFPTATGKTKNSVEVKVTGNKGQILAGGGALYLERGRPPAKSSSPKWNLSSLIEWMNAKGIGSGLPEPAKKRLASFFKYKINKDGTRKWQKGRGRIVDNIYTARFEQLDEEIEIQVKELLSEEFNLSYKGKNVIIS